MDTVPNLALRFAYIQTSFNDTFRALPNCLKISDGGPEKIERFIALSHKLETLHEKYRIEAMVLEAKNKTSSTKLLNLQAQIQLTTDRCQTIVDSVKSSLDEYNEEQRKQKERTQAEQIKIHTEKQSDVFNRFIKERIRSFSQEQATIREIHKAYNRWAVANDAPRLERKDLQVLCEEHLGNSHGTFRYIHYIVFLDEEDLEAWEQLQEENKQ